MSKHTPEPWTAYSRLIAGPDGLIITSNEENAARIVECVNAFAGIEKPAEFMAVVKELELDQAHKFKAERDELAQQLETGANQYAHAVVNLDEALRHIHKLVDICLRSEVHHNSVQFQDKIDEAITFHNQLKKTNEKANK